MGKERSDGKREKGWENRGVMGREIRDGKRDKGWKEREGMGRERRETMEQQVGRKKRRNEWNDDRGRRDKWKKTRRSRMEI